MMGATQVWLIGGPADGRIQLVEHDWNDQLPPTLDLPQTGVFVGTADEPAPLIRHRYHRDSDIDGQPTYRYEPATGTDADS